MPTFSGDYRDQDGEVHSRASDAGSENRSASDAGSTATMDTSMSANTLASGASTAFFSQQVHFFSLDDFAGHEIQTILEDGETNVALEDTNGDPDADRGSDQNQSVRPGSIVSNIDQRLDEIDGFPGEAQGEADGAPGSSSAVGGGATSVADAEAQYILLLQQMQHRDLTPADLQLLMLLEQQRANSNLPPFNLERSLNERGQGRGSGGSGSGGSGGSGAWISPPPVPQPNDYPGSGGGGKGKSSEYGSSYEPT